MRVKTTKFILAAILLIMAGMIGISTYSTTQQQKTTASQASENDTWQQCNDDFSNTPCGVCSVDNVNNGQVDFNCRLECGESDEDCPEGPGTQNISAKWITCDNGGELTCDSAQADFKEESAVENSPWIITKDSSANFVGSFPQIQCGRGSVEILMDAAGVDIAEGIFDTQVACNLPTSGPSPTGNTAVSPTGAISATISPQLTISPSVAITATVAPTSTVTTSPSPAVTAAISVSPTSTTTPIATVTKTNSVTPTDSAVYESPTQPPPVSGSAAPFFFIAIPFMLMILGFAI